MTRIPAIVPAFLGVFVLTFLVWAVATGHYWNALFVVACTVLGLQPWKRLWRDEFRRLYRKLRWKWHTFRMHGVRPITYRVNIDGEAVARHLRDHKGDAR